MGFCSGTQIFDDTVKTILETDASDETKVAIIAALIEALNRHDWDCEDDTNYLHEPLVKKAFIYVNPEYAVMYETN